LNVGFAASEVFRYTLSAVGARASGLRVYKQDIVLTLVVVSTSIVGLLTSEAARHLIDMPATGGSRAGAFVQGIFVFVAITIAWALVFLKPLWSRGPTGSRGVLQ